MSTVYEINKGINRSIEFKGVKGSYIIYMAVGLVLLLLLFAILYIVGLGTVIDLIVVVPLGIVFIVFIQRMSATYGEHGLVKKIASRYLPAVISSTSRQPFISLLNK